MFFVAAKVLWFLLQPSSVLLICVAVGLVLVTRGLVGSARGWLTGAMAIGVLALSPLPRIVSLPLEQRFERTDLGGDPVTGIIVLGGGEEAPVASRRLVHAINDAGERVTETVVLARRFPDARILITGGSGQFVAQPISEAAATGQMMIGMGLDQARVTVEGRSRDTWENAVFSRELVGPKAGERWLLVTSAWHMPRAMGVFRRVGFPVEPWPVDYRTAGWEDWLEPISSVSEGLARLDLMMKEYVGLVAYWFGGRSSALFPGPCVRARTCS